MTIDLTGRSCRLGLTAGWVATVVAAVVLGTPAGASAQDITGAGSTFVYPVMAKWSAAYQAQGFPRVMYHPVGSGAGVAQVRSEAVDFAASDAPLKPDVLSHEGLQQFPLVIGGLVPVVNIAGLKPGELKLTGGLLADIYLGKVRKWNDPAIAALNPGLALPGAPITVGHRTDSSGSTFNWANYLSKSSDEWRTRVGWGTTLAWPVGGGGNGNNGLATMVAQTPNSIGYVEYAYVAQKKLTYALVRNKAGKFVPPNAASFQAAAASADWAGTRDFSLMVTDAPGDDAYPIAATVFVLAHKEPKTPARRAPMLAFFRWVFSDGQAIAGGLDYVPLPPALVASIEAQWKTSVAAE
jgi:phosphate transport system substrate-binding protein